MQTIRKIYKIGYGPSSSHTMGPHTAAAQFTKKYPEATSFKITLYGSLALTGKGHLTDVTLINTLAPKKCEIIWQKETTLPYHPNALMIEALDENANVIASNVVYSVGGGDIVWDYEVNNEQIDENIYSMTDLSEMKNWAEQHGRQYWEYVYETEGDDIVDYLAEIWNVMRDAVKRGIESEGVIPGGLGLPRKACAYYTKALGYQRSLQSRALPFAYALAVAEENACGGKIVTAPTCGSCGVLPGVLYHLSISHPDFTDKRIFRALATGALVGNIVKFNASISGAEAGCQAEIGTACSMAAAAATQLFGGSPAQIEYAAEMAMEHHLGMTCDPVNGLVQIPCIERNAFAAARALDCDIYSVLSDGKHVMPFDKVVATMKQTGKDLPSLYKETSKGGLAAIF